MSIKSLRLKQLISQEELAGTSGLSLRTIQRAESGHRVSYSSLRALARVFEMDADSLEQELYSMDRIALGYKELPLWLRLYIGSGWFTASRREFKKIEVMFICITILFVLASASTLLWSFGHQRASDVFLFGSVMSLLGAYNVSITIRLGISSIFGHDLNLHFQSVCLEYSISILTKKRHHPQLSQTYTALITMLMPRH